MKDILGFEQKHEDGSTNTYFTLPKGTEVRLGEDVVTLVADTKFCYPGGIGRDALVGHLIIAKVGIDYSYTTKQLIDDKPTSVDVHYNGIGAPEYRLSSAKDSDPDSHWRPGAFGASAHPDTNTEGGAIGISEGVSAGAGVDLTTKEADKLDNPLQSMKSDAQLLQQFGSSDSKTKSTPKASAPTPTPKTQTDLDKEADAIADAEEAKIGTTKPTK